LTKKRAKTAIIISKSVGRGKIIKKVSAAARRTALSSLQSLKEPLKIA
jgi:hypothetical protein